MISRDEMRSQMADEIEHEQCAICDADITEDGRGSTNGECHVCRYRQTVVRGADEGAKARALLSLAWDAKDMKTDELMSLLDDLFEAGVRTGGDRERATVKRLVRQ